MQNYEHMEVDKVSDLHEYSDDLEFDYCYFDREINVISCAQ